MKNEIDDLIRQVDKEITKQETIYEIVAKAKQNILQLEADIEKYNQAIDILNVTNKEATRYLTLKQESMIKAIQLTLDSLSQMIKTPTHLYLHLDNGKISIRNQRGVDVGKSEGSGFRTILSSLIKTLAVINSSFSKLMILDEPISQANRENSIYFAECLRELSKDVQIFFVSQDAINYLDDVATVMYVVTPVKEGQSRVERIQ